MITPLPCSLHRHHTKPRTTLLYNARPIRRHYSHVNTRFQTQQQWSSSPFPPCPPSPWSCPSRTCPRQRRRTPTVSRAPAPCEGTTLEWPTATLTLSAMSHTMPSWPRRWRTRSRVIGSRSVLMGAFAKSEEREVTRRARLPLLLRVRRQRRQAHQRRPQEPRASGRALFPRLPMRHHRLLVNHGQSAQALRRLPLPLPLALTRRYHPRKS